MKIIVMKIVVMIEKSKVLVVISNIFLILNLFVSCNQEKCPDLLPFVNNDNSLFWTQSTGKSYQNSFIYKISPIPILIQGFPSNEYMIYKDNLLYSFDVYEICKTEYLNHNFGIYFDITEGPDTLNQCNIYLEPLINFNINKMDTFVFNEFMQVSLMDVFDEKKFNDSIYVFNRGVIGSKSSTIIFIGKKVGIVGITNIERDEQYESSYVVSNSLGINYLNNLTQYCFHWSLDSLCNITESPNTNELDDRLDWIKEFKQL